MNDQSRSGEQELDRGTKALRESVADDPPTWLVEATIERLESPNFGTRYSMRKRFRMALVAALVLVAVGLGTALIVPHASGLALAQAIENVKEAESVRFTVRRPGSDSIMRAYIQGDVFRLESDSKVGGALEAVSLIDYAKKERLEFNYRTKVVYRQHDDDLSPSPNPIERLTKLRADGAERLLDETIGGRKAQVFRVTKLSKDVRPVYQEIQTIWIDPQTELPMRINWDSGYLGGTVVGDYRAGQQGGSLPANQIPRSVHIFDDFHWNEALDPKLFEFEVPEGFAERKLGP